MNIRIFGDTIYNQIAKKGDAMQFLKKWGLIAGIFFGSFMALIIIAIPLKKYAGLDLGGSIVGIYAAIFMLWCIFIVLKTMFKGSSFLMRRYYLFLAKFYFKKKYPQVNYSEFSTMRLFKMCNVKLRFPNLDIPLLDDEELDRLNTETNIMNAKSAAKATWWATKTTAKATWWATKTTAKVSLKTLEVTGKTLEVSGNIISGMTGGASAQSRSSTINPGSSTTNQASSASSASSSAVDTPVTSTSSPPIDWYGKAYAIQGAVVTKSDGSSMAYYKKCEACGYVDTTSHVQTSAPRKGEVFDTYFLCSKCQNNQRLKIGAG